MGSLVLQSRYRRLTHRKRGAARSRSGYQSRLAAVKKVSDHVVEALLGHLFPCDPASIDLVAHEAD